MRFSLLEEPECQRSYHAVYGDFLPFLAGLPRNLRYYFTAADFGNGAFANRSRLWSRTEEFIAALAGWEMVRLNLTPLGVAWRCGG